MAKFEKQLTANDVGLTGTHQAGIHIPKSAKALLSLLPKLNPRIRNPDAWFTCIDENGHSWRLRYIYYNSKLFGDGTRDEYRLTQIVRFLKASGADTGDYLVLGYENGDYRIELRKEDQNGLSIQEKEDYVPPLKIKLKGWREVH